MNNLAIHSITPLTTTDFPGVPSAIVWFSGCNMRCKFCYNPKIVFSKGKMKIADVVTFLKSKRDTLKGVILSGGEATISRHLIMLCNNIKELNYLIKLETNGSNPRTIQYLTDRKLIDFVSVDFKANEKNFVSITKSKKSFYTNLVKTFKILNKSTIAFEVRTTVHSDLLKEEDIIEIMEFLSKLRYKGTYVIQNFLHKETIGNMLKPVKSISKEAISNKAKELELNIEWRNFN